MVWRKIAPKLAISIALTSLFVNIELPAFSQKVSTTPSLQQGFADLVEPLLPAVVNISTTTQIHAQSDLSITNPLDTPLPKGSPIEDFFKDFLERMQPEGPRSSSAVGSGFIIDPEGYIVTNNHVISEADQITVTLSDNTELKATLVGRDRRTDIALLKISTEKKLPYVQWGDSQKLRVGEWIIAIGNALGFGGTVTTGIVSHLARDIESKGQENGSGDFIEGYIQTDASINLGNSGGPMFNMQGQVVGVNTAIYTHTGGNIGIGFAIPSEIAKKVIDQIRQYGRTKRGWIGVRIQPITSDIAEGLGLKKPEGVLIGSVIEKGPAAKAQLQSGDVVLKVGDLQVEKDPRSLPRLIGNLPVGSKILLTLWRRGKIITKTITIGEYEEAEETGMIASPDNGKKLLQGIEIHGLTLQPLSSEIKQRFDIDTKTKGVLIVDVSAKSSAAEKGVRAGDIIVEISQEPVQKPQDIVNLIKTAEKAGRKSILLLIDRDDALRYVSIKIVPDGQKS